MIRLLVIFFSIFIDSSYATDVTAINNFDINKYSGNWYEVARLPNKFEKNCTVPIEASYLLAPDDNSKINIVNKCQKVNNESSIVNGTGYFIESVTTGKFKISFLSKWLSWLPIGKGKYYIMYTDYKTVALVGSPDHKYLWILSRYENLNSDIMNKVVFIAKAQGYETNTLIYNYKN